MGAYSLDAARSTGDFHRADSPATVRLEKVKAPPSAARYYGTNAGTGRLKSVTSGELNPGAYGEY
jgi:hypothetical protein